MHTSLPAICTMVKRWLLCVVQLNRLEVASQQHVNPWEAAAELNSSGRDLTTRGGMRLHSYSGSTTLTPVKEPQKDSSSGGSSGPFAASQAQHEALPSNPQSPQQPNHQRDASDGMPGPYAPSLSPNHLLWQCPSWMLFLLLPCANGREGTSLTQSSSIGHGKGQTNRPFSAVAMLMICRAGSDHL